MKRLLAPLSLKKREGMVLMKWALLLALANLPLIAQNAFYQDLSGEWRTKLGDDPGWASPTLDDGDWSTLQLPLQRVAGPIGNNWWNQDAWVRRSFFLPAGTRTDDLVLTLGGYRRRYHVFVNGTLAGSVDALGGGDLYPRAHFFPLRAGVLRAGEKNVIAVRGMRGEGTVQGLMVTFAGAGPFALTSSLNAPTPAPAADRDARLRFGTLAFTAVVLYLVFAILMMLLWIGNRTEWTLLGLAVMLFAEAINRGTEYLSLFLDTAIGSSGVSFFLSGTVLSFVVFEQFDLRRPRQRAILLIPLIVAFAKGAGSVESIVYDASALFWWALVAGEIFLLARRWNRYRGRRWILAALIVITALWTTRTPGRLRLSMSSGQIGGFYVRGIDASILLMSLVLIVLMVRRLLDDRREKQRLAGEFEAARAVQQLLLPASASTSKAFAVEAIYQPAEEVGGDFHWSRTDEDGSLLVAVGDVSGKGLKAAMLVSVAVGVLRTVEGTSPGAVLTALNRALYAQTAGGFVTCTCVRFEVGGGIVIASAGHPAPYIDGVEATLHPGLPLGILSSIRYDETTIQGASGTLVSDGVPEATRPDGELFGFERTRAMSGKSAAEIAKAARVWGQNDDITVLTVRRTA